MKRLTYCVLPAITALSCMALGLIGDPRAFFEGGTLAGIAAHAQKAPITPLSVNDVSWLFPAPKSFDDLISMDDLSANGDPIWSDNAFRQFITIANGPAGHVIGTDQRIELPAAVRSKRAWYIAAVCFDPSAPGFSDQIRDQFGQELQIRLVVQPVTRNDDGTPKVHDIAGHLLFEFNSGRNKSPVEEGCFSRPQPDRDLAVQVARELADVRDVAGANVTTAKPLGIHPGLDPNNPETNPAARTKLRRTYVAHVSEARCDGAGRQLRLRVQLQLAPSRNAV
jgi:hypothetical protein